MKTGSAYIARTSSSATTAKEAKGQKGLSSVSTTESDQIEGQMSLAEYLDMLTPEGKIIPDDFMNPPEKLKPTLGKVECEYHANCLCNRYGYKEQLEIYKADLPKGYACSACCWYCPASHDGRCKWRCYVEDRRIKKG